MNLFVEQRRGHAVEATHAVDAVACDADGKVSVLSGVDSVTTFRSAAKPFQLAATLEHLPRAVVAGLASEDLALGGASHHGEPLHLAALAHLLTKLQVDVADLFCGAHAPTHAPSAAALIARGAQPTALHNNCAGKHAFMAAAARALGAPRDYRPRAHPLQRHLLARVRALSGDPGLDTVVDGCGVPCFVLPLSAMARAWSALAVATRDVPDAGLGAIGRAYAAHPLLASGTEAFDGWLMQNTPVLAKVGATGLLCVAVPALGVGLAIKIRSGSELARPLAAMALLEAHVPAVTLPPLPVRYVAVTNVVGDRVGEWVTRLAAG
ncbi:MAG: asparaginase [Polyangiales bacterium]